MIEVSVTEKGARQMRDIRFRQKILGMLEEFRECDLIR